MTNNTTVKKRTAFTEMLKTLLIKITQNPAYYNTRHQAKFKMRSNHRHVLQ